MKSIKNLNKIFVFIVPVLIFYVAYVYIGYLGVEYGKHWDEWHAFALVKGMVERFVFVPEVYTYNGMYTQIAMLDLWPDILKSFPQIIREFYANPSRPFDGSRYAEFVELQKNLLIRVDSGAYVTRVRILYVLISSLTLVWTYLSIGRLTKNNIAALCAVIWMGSSFEIQYHTRWIAVDAVLMQFTTLMFLFLIEALTSFGKRQQLFIKFGSFTAGVVFSCKAPGVLTLIPILVASIITRKGDNKKSNILNLVTPLILLFLAGFLIFNPGALVDPLRFVTSMVFEKWSYNNQTGSTYTHYASGFFDHAGRAFVWLLYVVPGGGLLSFFITVLCIFGSIKLWKAHRPLFYVMYSYIVVYSLFIGSNHLFIVRNWLALAPLIFIFAGIGISTLYESKLPLIIANSLLGLIIAICMLNIYNNLIVAEEVKYKSRMPLKEFFESSKDGVYVSNTLLNELEANGYRCDKQANKVINGHYAFKAADQHWTKWIAGNPFVFLKVYGSKQTNFNYYPTWLGYDQQNRIFLASEDTIRKMGMGINIFTYCRLEQK